MAGCNVENAAYGVGLCAECGMVSELHATGGGKLVAVSCVGGDGQPLMPCGRCRQLLWENGGPECLLLTPEGVLPMREVLPQAFGPDNLDRRPPPRLTPPGPPARGRPVDLWPLVAQIHADDRGARRSVPSVARHVRTARRLWMNGRPRSRGCATVDA